MDLSMPDQSGVDALAAIKARAPDLPVLILSRLSRRALRDDPAAPGGERLPQQGLRPRGDRQGDPHRRTAAASTSPPASPSCSPTAWAAAGDKPAHEQLSEREFQVFLRLAKGETIGHMADSMSLSVKTVSTYRTRVMEKMKLASNSDLTYYALKNGLIQ